jgi:assimilatory nitrate reductase electron transfer subunit
LANGGLGSDVRVVVIGNGMVGSRVVQELLDRDLDRRLTITVIGDEPGGAYNRMLLSNVLAGATSDGEITLASESWYAGHDVALRAGVAAVRIDRVRRLVALDDGGELPYDVLVLATGSEPIVPPVPGLRGTDGEILDGAIAFRTLADCAEIDRRAHTAQHAVVVGGGLLGLEAARGLAGRGVPVTVVQRAPNLMEQQLESGASRVLGRTLRATGIEVIAPAELQAVRGLSSVRGVTLGDGTKIDADLLVLCCGVRPRIEVARAAGLAVNRGILVEDSMRSVTDPSVFAVGECSEHRGQVYGLVAPGWDQARVAADVIVGRASSYTGSRVVTRLKAAGIELAAMGETIADGDDDVCFIDGARGVYQKLVVRDGVLVGAILLGDTRAAGTVTQFYDRGATVPIDRAALLLVRRNAPATVSNSPTLMPGHATVCQCNGVTKSAICDAWEGGAQTVSEVARCTRATTGCGSCRELVEGLVDWLAAADAGTRDATDESTSGTERATEAVPA